MYILLWFFDLVWFLDFFFLRFSFNVFIWERKNKRTSGKGQKEREKQTSPWAGTPTWGSIPGPQDHDLSWRQMFNQLSHPGTPRDFIYLFMRDTHRREAETQAEGEAGSMQGARHETRSQILDHRIKTWAESRRSTTQVLNRWAIQAPLVRNIWRNIHQTVYIRVSARLLYFALYISVIFRYFIYMIKNTTKIVL